MVELPNLRVFRSLTRIEQEHRERMELVAEQRARMAAEWNASGFSYAEIAEGTGLSRSRIQQLVERGR